MGASDEHLLATTLATVARTLAAGNDVNEVISRACQLAVDTIDACQHADVMLVGDKRNLLVPAATDWVGTRVVSLEDETQEGPCIDAYRTRAPVECPDLESEQRWPRFVARCLAETPVRSGLGLPLLHGNKAFGALDLYADEPKVFHEDDLAVAALFASHASIAIGAAKERVEFKKALASRDVIGQAKGILMAQSQISADDAFDLLRRASQRLNVKLAAVAQDIVDKTATS